MTDLTVTRSGELMVAHVQAESDEASEFVDAYVPSRNPAEFTVVDSGRIILSTDDEDEFVVAARRRGLVVEVEIGKP